MKKVTSVLLKSIYQAAGLAILISISSAISWANNGWGSYWNPTSSVKVTIGSTFLMNRNDADYLSLPGDGVCGISKLQIGISGDSAIIYDLKVKFANGEVQDIPVRQTFMNGSHSLWKDLNGFTRCIKGIYIYGKSNQRTPQQTKVTFYGLKVVQNAHEVLLGKTAIMNREDADLIQLSQPVCGLTKFKIIVKEDAVRIEALKVQFGNGQIEQFHVNQVYQPGTGTSWMDLIGNTRCISKIFILGKSNPATAKQAIVEFWGLQK